MSSLKFKSHEGKMYNGNYANERTYNRNNRHRGSSFHSTPTQKRETGVIEKLLNSYGFIEYTSQDARIFFHYSEFNGDPQGLHVGDPVEFTATSDYKSNKSVAVRVRPLPAGSVAIDTFCDSPVIGVVETEARPSSSGLAAEPCLGNVSYERNGEVLFLPFALRDVEKGGTLIKGDRVSFLIATDKRNGTLKARKLVLVEAAEKPKIQGIVSSLKDSFGFIERADMVAEIFFHYSEFQGDIRDVMIGDDVEFGIQQRKDKEVAIQVTKLAAGAVEFEDISEEKFRGKVVKPVAQKLSPRSSVDGQLSGVIEYNNMNDTKEVLFGDRDTEGDIQLQIGDTVEFNISTDRRDGLERAVNIGLVHVSVKNGEIRENGIIAVLKDGFGFIKCCDRDLSLFFHFSELLEQAKVISVGDEVEFTIAQDCHSGKPHATRIRTLTKGTVNMEIVTMEDCQGVVDKEPHARNSKRDGDTGIILYTGESEVIPVLYRGRDCKSGENPQYGDIVKFQLITFKRTGQFAARDVTVSQKSLPTRHYGFVCALKDSFGFIEFANHEKEVFFHYRTPSHAESQSSWKLKFFELIAGLNPSPVLMDNGEVKLKAFLKHELNCDPNTLTLGDEVEFSTSKKNGKVSAERIIKIPNASIQQEDILPDILDGVVTKPMRIWDPEQDEYEGLIALTNSPKEDCCENEAPPLMYRFGITSLVKKKEPLQIGDKVTFQIGMDQAGIKQRAVNVTSVRDLCRGKIESVKGQYGFITYELENCKNLFFHISEVVDADSELQPGDTVEFVIVKSHKNAKQSAIQIRKIPEECNSKPALRKRLSLPPKSKTFYVIRQPSLPDGTTGFHDKRRQSESDQDQKEDQGEENYENE